MDGDWTNEVRVGNLTPLTPDNYLDDQPRAFVVGNGTNEMEAGEFRFHFAILRGDFDGDGYTGGADYLLWELTTDLRADANMDGVVDSADRESWTAGLNFQLPLRTLKGADLYDDEIVDYADLAKWISGFGQSGEGDVDDDGDTDGDDFLLWQQLMGEKSAWYIEPEMGPEDLIGDFAPTVLNVIISGSHSLHTPFSFATVDGSGSQLKTVPVGGADTISIVFSEAVNVSASSLAVIGLRTANMPHVADFHYDPLTYMATWRFEGWSPANQYLLSLSDGVTDVDRNPLDGEWTNPKTTTTTNAAVSEFPSGDGTPGGRFNFLMTLMPGDMNLDNVVNSTDWYLFGVSGPNSLFTQGDFTGDGWSMYSGDGTFISVNYGVNLQSLSMLADFDGDCDVDDADLAVIVTNANLTGAVWADGDLNGDGAVTVADLDLAYSQYKLDLDVAA